MKITRFLTSKLANLTLNIRAPTHSNTKHSMYQKLPQYPMSAHITPTSETTLLNHQHNLANNAHLCIIGSPSRGW